MQNLDDQILLFINSFHNQYFDIVMWNISGKWLWIPFYISLVWLVWKRFGWKGLCVVLAAVGLTFAITDHFSIQVFRGIFSRMRPSNPDNPISPLVHIVNEYRSGRYGFPSAHAANTAGLAVLLSFYLRDHRQTLMLTLWVVLVCYSRMYLGVHYLGDLLGGAFFGALIASAVYYASRHIPLVMSPQPYDRRAAMIPSLVCIATVLGICILAFF